MPTPLPIVEATLEANFPEVLAFLPPDEAMYERERRHAHDASFVADTMLRRRPVVWPAAEDVSDSIVRSPHDYFTRATSVGAVLHCYAYKLVAEIGTRAWRVGGHNSEARRHFQELVRKWHQETDHLSSPAEIAMNFNYQQIIGKGERYLPFIVEELRAHGGKWYWALRAITSADPVPRADRGNVAKMKQAWLDWLEQNLK